MFCMHMDVLSMGPPRGEEAFKMNLAKITQQNFYMLHYNVFQSIYITTVSSDLKYTPYYIA